MIELTVAQGHEHGLVLILHHLPNGVLQPVVADVLRVARLRRLQDASTIHEDVRDDVRMLDARVFGLDVKDSTLVADVVVVAEEGRRSFRHPAPKLTQGRDPMGSRLQAPGSRLQAGEVGTLRREDGECSEPGA